jgi:hypothetical protein
MSSFSIFIDILVVAYILSRQLRVRPVPRFPRVQLPLIIGIIGLIQVLGYTGDHHVTTDEYAWVIGAGLLGAVRALTVKIWTTNNWVVRQGTWVTMTLWVISLALHFASDVGASHVGAANLEENSLLLYLAVTLGVQNYVVHRRALPLWESLGPEAGRRIQVNFARGPAGGGAFFSNFGNGGPGYPPPPRHDPTIIDAEVVDDDEGPPQLR